MNGVVRTLRLEGRESAEPARIVGFDGTGSQKLRLFDFELLRGVGIEGCGVEGESSWYQSAGG